LLEILQRRGSIVLCGALLDRLSRDVGGGGVLELLIRHSIGGGGSIELAHIVLASNSREVKVGHEGHAGHLGLGQARHEPVQLISNGPGSSGDAPQHSLHFLSNLMRQILDVRVIVAVEDKQHLLDGLTILLGEEAGLAREGRRGLVLGGVICRNLVVGNLRLDALELFGLVEDESIVVQRAGSREEVEDEGRTGELGVLLHSRSEFSWGAVFGLDALLKSGEGTFQGCDGVIDLRAVGLVGVLPGLAVEHLGDGGDHRHDSGHELANSADGVLNSLKVILQSLVVAGDLSLDFTGEVVNAVYNVTADSLVYTVDDLSSVLHALSSVFYVAGNVVSDSLHTVANSTSGSTDGAGHVVKGVPNLVMTSLNNALAYLSKTLTGLDKALESLLLGAVNGSETLLETLHGSCRHKKGGRDNNMRRCKELDML